MQLRISESFLSDELICKNSNLQKPYMDIIN